MFSSNPFPYTKNKSKEFYCRCYAVKVFLYFSFFIFPSFQIISFISCYVKNFHHFLGGSYLFGDFFSFPKSGSQPPKKFCFVFFIESPLKIMKNAFFSFSRYLNFCYDFLVIKTLDKKDKVNFKIHDVRNWLTSNCNTHIAHYLTKKDNQTMKVGQLIEYIRRNIFL